MQERYIKYFSHHLGRNIELLIYGEWGYPVLLFPTTMGRYYEAKDFHLTDAIRDHVESGHIKLYCIDSIDSDSWYARHLPPNIRIQNHIFYDRCISEELVPAIQRECNVAKIGVAGCSFGGFQALNYAFRHPDQVAHLMSMGAKFDIRGFMDGYYDDNVYFNNPPDYLPGLQNDHLYQMKIVLGTSEHDFCKDSNIHMSHLLTAKNVPHRLDIKPWGDHDWPVWREQFPEYLNGV